MQDVLMNHLQNCNNSRGLLSLTAIGPFPSRWRWWRRLTSLTHKGLSPVLPLLNKHEAVLRVKLFKDLLGILHHIRSILIILLGHLVLCMLLVADPLGLLQFRNDGLYLLLHLCDLRCDLFSLSIVRRDLIAQLIDRTRSFDCLPRICCTIGLTLLFPLQVLGLFLLQGRDHVVNSLHYLSEVTATERPNAQGQGREPVSVSLLRSNAQGICSSAHEDRAAGGGGAFLEKKIALRREGLFEEVP
mmetsp:Transcript_93804/g.235521  ORF Transcript_93804/g.235521 Transcript_93804/m.235521 type:complete len:244 (-) Transcript_93804:1132-1863(-)